MTAAREAAAEGAEDGLVIWAESQDAGRGRSGREWSSPPGNLYCSLLLRPNCRADQAAELSFVTALSVWSSVASLLPRTVSVQCKWPNDILVRGRKISGILLESGAVSGNTVGWLIIGVGINVISHPELGVYPTTSLKAEGVNSTVEEVLSGYLNAFAGWREVWRKEGFAAVRRAWLEKAVGLGQHTKVRIGEQELAGRFDTIDTDGALILIQGGERRRITAGDVFFETKWEGAG